MEVKFIYRNLIKQKALSETILLIRDEKYNIDIFSLRSEYSWYAVLLILNNCHLCE